MVALRIEYTNIKTFQHLATFSKDIWNRYLTRALEVVQRSWENNNTWRVLSISLFIKDLFENIKLLNFSLLEKTKKQSWKKNGKLEDCVELFVKYMAKDIHNT